jgi:hypothetical protein
MALAYKFQPVMVRDESRGRVLPRRYQRSSPRVEDGGSLPFDEEQRVSPAKRLAQPKFMAG